MTEITCDFEKTPYKNIPIKEIPKKIIKMWDKYSKDEIKENRMCYTKYQLRFWGFLPPSGYRKLSTIDPEKLRQERLIYRRKLYAKSKQRALELVQKYNTEICNQNIKV